MSVSQHEANLARLQDEIQRALADAGVEASSLSECANLADALPLAHSMSEAAFRGVAEDKLKVGWQLLSPARLDRLHIKRLRPDSAEAVLGTADFVFLYCGQFRYPNTTVGFLFSKSLEEERSADCEASPFDSGALTGHALWPDACESAVDFLARHTVPVPAYRGYLARRIQLLFAKPADYLDPGAEPIRPDPIGLRPSPPVTKRDARLWTSEVRVRDHVTLSPPHLEAVFYTRRDKRWKAVRAFLAARQGAAQLDSIRPEDEGDFNALQRKSIEYLKTKGILP
jgi:hypothetical protein